MNRSVQAVDIYNLDSLIFEQPGMSTADIQRQLLNWHPFLQKNQARELIVMKPRKESNKTSVFLWSIFLLYLFAGFKGVYGKNVFFLFNQFSPTAIGRKLNSVKTSGHSLVYVLVYLSSLSFILYSYLKKYGQFSAKQSLSELFLTSVLICFGLYLVKTALQRIVAWAFVKPEVYVEYQGSLVSITEIAAMVLFPICIVLFMSSGLVFTYILMIAIGLVALIALFRFFRMIISLKKIIAFHFLHFFIYLCAFEILPILATCKYLMR